MNSFDDLHRAVEVAAEVDEVDARVALFLTGDLASPRSRSRGRSHRSRARSACTSAWRRASAACLMFCVERVGDRRHPRDGVVDEDRLLEPVEAARTAPDLSKSSMRPSICLSREPNASATGSTASYPSARLAYSSFASSMLPGLDRVGERGGVGRELADLALHPRRVAVGRRDELGVVVPVAGRVPSAPLTVKSHDSCFAPGHTILYVPGVSSTRERARRATA